MASEEKMQNVGKTKMVRIWKNINSLVTDCFVLVMLAVFPLMFHDYYFDILVFRYQFYYLSVIAFATIMLLIVLVFLLMDVFSNEGKNIKEIWLRRKKKIVFAPDWAMVVFVSISVISTFQSEYFYESFWGNEGRYCGLFLTLLYGVSYFLVTRTLQFKHWHLDAFLASGFISCMIGILQYFRFNPFGLKTGLSLRDYRMFASTFGNINSYTSYLALTVGVGAVLFCVEERIWKKQFYLLSVAISLLALITGISDNAYLTLIALMGLLPLYLFTNLRGVKQYALICSVLSTELVAIDWVNNAFPSHVIGIEGLFEVISGFAGLSYLTAVFWMLTVVLYALDMKNKNSLAVSKATYQGRWIWLGILVAVIMVMCGILVDVNFLGNGARYGSLEKYLLITDDWGTHRWYIWRLAMNSFREFPLHHKIFGYGPDTFGIINVYNYLSETVSRYYEKYDSAHNEYIQYLVTIGFAGLIAYVMLLGTSLIKMISAAVKSPAIMGIVFAVGCYSVQAFVNISVPIVAPIMMTLLMVGVAACRGENNQNHTETYEEEYENHDIATKNSTV